MRKWEKKKKKREVEGVWQWRVCGKGGFKWGKKKWESSREGENGFTTSCGCRGRREIIMKNKKKNKNKKGKK